MYFAGPTASMVVFTHRCIEIIQTVVVHQPRRMQKFDPDLPHLKISMLLHFMNLFLFNARVAAYVIALRMMQLNKWTRTEDSDSGTKLCSHTLRAAYLVVLSSIHWFFFSVFIKWVSKLSMIFSSWCENVPWKHYFADLRVCISL